MSRVMKRAGITNFANATITTIVTCPADHKLEVIAGSVQGGTTAGCFAGLLLHADGTYIWVMVEKDPVEGAACRPFGPVVLQEGESVVAYASAGVGGTAAAWCTYVDVFPI